MAAAFTTTSLYAFRTQDGALVRVARLDLTGAAVGNNAVAHGLTQPNSQQGAKPIAVGIEPTATGSFYEYQAADATNIYINAPAANATCSVYVEY